MRVGILFLALTLLTASPARADDLADFNAAIEVTMVQRRALTDYLVSADRERAMVELEGMREAWGKASALPRPAAFGDQARYTATMLDVSTRMVTIALVLNLGRRDVALELLEAIRTSLSSLRRENGVTVLSDCVADADTDFTALLEASERPDFANGSLNALVDAYRTTLARCEKMASPSVRDRQDFRKPIDGSLAILAQLPQAIEARDEALLGSLLKPLRDLNDALARQYG